MCIVENPPINHECRLSQGPGKSWGRVATGDGEHNVTAHSTEPITTPYRRGSHDVDLAHRPCHVPRNSVWWPHASASV